MPKHSETTHDSDPRRAIEAQLVRRLLDRAGWTLLASLLVASFVFWGLRTQVDPTALGAWLALQVLVTGTRIAHVLLSKRSVGRLDLRASGHRYGAGALLSGLLWAGLAGFYDPAQPALLQLLILVILVGMPVASLAEDAKYLPVYYAFNLPIMLALGGWALWFGGDYRVSFLVIDVAYSLLVLGAAHQYNRNLRESIERGLQNERLVRDLERSNRALEALAYVDPLTKLANRRQFELEANKTLGRLQHEPGRTFMLMLIDVDRFKQVNDTYGHEVGDRLLVAIADRLRDSLRADDLTGRSHSGPARLGGDEFVAIFAHPLSKPEVLQTAARITAALTRDCVGIEPAIQPSVSVGIALAPPHGTDLRTLLVCADQAMYQAKRIDGAQFAVYRPDDAKDRLVVDLPAPA